VIFHVDMAPLGRALISRSQQMWRLTGLESGEARRLT
jgi:hypothetical protein